MLWVWDLARLARHVLLAWDQGLIVALLGILFVRHVLLEAIIATSKIKVLARLAQVVSLAKVS